MENKLPGESFVALAAVAWADGRMTKVEAQGLAQAARALGLGAEDLAAVEKATREKVTLAGFDAAKLSPWQRLLTYGLACWLARLDGVQQTEELASLRELAGKLAHAEVSDHRLRAAEAVAINVAMLPEGRRPERYDFAALERELSARLPAVK